MSVPPTQRCDPDDDACTRAAPVLAAKANALALDRIRCYTHGGGRLRTKECWRPTAWQLVSSAGARADGCPWHALDRPLPEHSPGADVTLSVDPGQRVAHARHHAPLHVLGAQAAPA